VTPQAAESVGVFIQSVVPTLILSFEVFLITSNTCKPNNSSEIQAYTITYHFEQHVSECLWSDQGRYDVPALSCAGAREPVAAQRTLTG
jgi:hypothetical protein